MRRVTIVAAALSYLAACGNQPNVGSQRLISDYNAFHSLPHPWPEPGSVTTPTRHLSAKEVSDAAEMHRLQQATDRREISQYGASNVYGCRANAAIAYSWEAGNVVYSNCLEAGRLRAAGR